MTQSKSQSSVQPKVALITGIIGQDGAYLAELLLKNGYTIHELAELVSEVVGFKGKLTFDTSKPDGTMRKVMDISRINALGWKRTMQLKDGITLSYQDMLSKI